MKAQIVTVDALSTHPAQGELLQWLSNFERPPKMTFIVHGEKDASKGLKDAITERFGWDVSIPSMRQTFDLVWG